QTAEGAEVLEGLALRRAFKHGQEVVTVRIVPENILFNDLPTVAGQGFDCDQSFMGHAVRVGGGNNDGARIGVVIVASAGDSEQHQDCSQPRNQFHTCVSS